MTLNISNVILILVSVLFYYVYNDILILFLAFWGLFWWSYHGFRDERKKHWKAETELLNAKAEYYKSRARRIDGVKNDQ